MKRVIYRGRQINRHEIEQLWWFYVMIEGKKERRCRSTLRAAKEMIDNETKMPELRDRIGLDCDGRTRVTHERDKE